MSSTVDKASDKEMSFISLCVLPRGSFMGTFLELINKLKSSKWGVGFPERNYKTEPVPLGKGQVEFFPERLFLISSQFASSNRRDLTVYGNNMQKVEMLLKRKPKSTTEQCEKLLAVLMHKGRARSVPALLKSL